MKARKLKQKIAEIVESIDFIIESEGEKLQGIVRLKECRQELNDLIVKLESFDGNIDYSLIIVLVVRMLEVLRSWLDL